MAEIVDYRVEKTLDELKLLVDFGIFDEQHAKEIVAKREQFEYLLRRRTKSKLEFTKYIKFEMNLLNSIEKYRKTVLRTKPKDPSEELDHKILKLQAKKLSDIIRSRSAHISFLFRRLTTSFQFDKRLWLAYIDFAKQRKWNARVSALYWRLLRVVSDDEDIWVAAAMHEVQVNETIDTAKKIYLMGLRHHPKSIRILSKLAEICDAESLKKYREAIANEATETADKRTKKSKAPQQSKMEILYECYDSKGLDETRKLFEDLEKSVKNQTLSLYVGMIQVESWQLAKDKSKDQLDRLRAIYNKALLKFGRTKAKLWYEYLQFEYQNAKTLDDFERINQLYTRAQATLDPSKVDRVIEKYNLMQVNPSKTDIEYSDYSDLED